MNIDEIKEEISHKEALIQALVKSLRIMELKSVQFGIYVPPYLELEIEETKKKIEYYQGEIKNLQDQLSQINNQPKNLTDSYSHLSIEDLQTLLKLHIDNLAELEKQKASHGITVPLIIVNQIKDTRESINSIQSLLNRKKSSPEAQINNNESSLDFSVRQYIEAAEAHLKIDNIDMAIQYINKSIDILPTSKAFLMRAKIYSQRSDKNKQIISDLGNAIKLADSRDLEEEARMMRVRLTSEINIREYDKIWEEDVSLLKKRSKKSYVAEILFLEVVRLDDYQLFKGNEKFVIDQTSHAILNGYSTSRVYYARARAFYGLISIQEAIEDIDIAIQMNNTKDEKANYLSLKASIFGFQEAFSASYDIYSEASSLFPGHDAFPVLGLKNDINHMSLYNFLCTATLDIEFNNTMMDPNQILDIERLIVQFNNTFPELVTNIESICPDIASLIHKLSNKNKTNPEKDSQSRW